MTYHHENNAEFLANIDQNADGLHAVLACGEDCEPSFSWYQCQLCDSGLGGDRHDAALIAPGTDAEPIELSVCLDCLCYLANGDLPHSH